MSKIVIDSDTGEIKTTLEPGDRIVKAKTVEYLKDTETWKIEHFYKTNLREINKWMKDLTPNEKAILFTVSPNVGYEDCCLKYENGIPLTFDSIVDLSGLSRGAVSTALNSLIAKDILYKGRNSKGLQYFINPWLYCKGNRINSVLKTMFQNYQIRVINRKWKDL